MALTSGTAWWRQDKPEQTWRLYEDFRVFLAVTWKYLRLPPPTSAQLEIAHYLQHGSSRIIVEAFRGVGKSWITSAFVCWLLLRNPQLKIMVVSAAKDRADNFTTFTMQLISNMPQLQHLAPTSNQRNSKIAFDVAPSLPDHAPSVRSVGIMGQMTGGRADYIIADDVEVPNNSETANMREKLDSRSKEFEAILKPLAHASIIFLGTPQTEESLYNGLPEAGYVPRFWPARYPTEKQMDNYGGWLAPSLAQKVALDPTLAGTPTDARFDADDLLAREARYGRAGFALQFMLDTRLADADRYPLKIGDLIVDNCSRELGPETTLWGQAGYWSDVECVGFKNDRYWKPLDYLRDKDGIVRRIPYQGKLMAIDPAGRGRDECAYAVVYMLHSTLYLMAVGAVEGYDEDSLQTLAGVAKTHGVNEIVIESNFGDGMFSALLKPVLAKNYPCTVEEVHSTGQKELRIIDTLEPVMSNHRLVVDKAVIEHDYTSTMGSPPEMRNRYRLMYQLSRITRDRGALQKDDRLDALTLAVGRWVESMAKSQEDAAGEAEDRRMEDALANWGSSVLGQSDHTDTDVWMNLAI